MSEEAKEETSKEATVDAVVVPSSQVDDEDVPLTFPQKLMQVVSDEENNDIVSWLPHGKGFIIYKKKKFASDVLPKYFKNSKYTSFTRKLNRWGFTRVTRGPETGAYYHKFFQRGEPRLCMQMTCQSSKNPISAQQMGFTPFGAGKGYPGDPQNQQLIRQQLQQLQLHQFHLQQMQMQQMQAAEMFRQQQTNNKSGEGGDDDNKDKEDNKSGDEKPSEGAAPAAAMPQMDVNNPYFQQFQAGMTPSMAGLFPVFPGGVPMGAMPPAPGVAMPPAPAAPTEEAKASSEADASGAGAAI